VLLTLSVRLGVLVTEVERLPMPVIAEYVALLNDVKPVDVDRDLMSIFGRPDGQPRRTRH
jgi:hypothetical protein